MTHINLETIKTEVILAPPSILGAAVKIMAVGGSNLDADQMARASGSAYLMKQHGAEVRRLVGLLEQSAPAAA